MRELYAVDHKVNFSNKVLLKENSTNYGLKCKLLAILFDFITKNNKADVNNLECLVGLRMVLEELIRKEHEILALRN